MLNDSHRFPASSSVSTGSPARTASPTSATITCTTPSAGARRVVLSNWRSSTSTAAVAASTWASAMPQLLFGWTVPRPRHSSPGLRRRRHGRWQCRHRPGRATAGRQIVPWRVAPRDHAAPVRRSGANLPCGSRRPEPPVLLAATPAYTWSREAIATARAALACATAALSSGAASSANTSPACTWSPLRTLIAPSWPPISGAMTTSVVRTTPTIGAGGSGRKTT